MLRISASQFASIAEDARHQFLLQNVTEWFALFKACYGRPARLSFGAAWKTADFVHDEIDDLPQRVVAPVDYTFIHTVLTAANNGATPDQLRAGVAAFCAALPADEAGLIMFESICWVEPRVRA